MGPSGAKSRPAYVDSFQNLTWNYDLVWRAEGALIQKCNSTPAQEGERHVSATTDAMRQSPRCGAKTRSGGQCLAPAVSGRRRCRMHGGAVGSGAPKGNQNALKHGRFTREEITRRRHLRDLLRKSDELLRELESE